MEIEIENAVFFVVVLFIIFLFVLPLFRLPVTSSQQYLLIRQLSIRPGRAVSLVSWLRCSSILFFSNILAHFRCCHYVTRLLPVGCWWVTYWLSWLYLCLCSSYRPRARQISSISCAAGKFISILCGILLERCELIVQVNKPFSEFAMPGLVTEFTELKLLNIERTQWK